jgi:threonine dehydratase
VVQTEGDLLDTCLALRDERTLTLVHPFDDPLVMAGQGTVGLEIVEDVPGVDVVIVPVGGGGLIGGVATSVKGLRPSARVFGVEPEAADAMTRSLAAGAPVHLDHPRTIADGLAAPFAGEHTLAQAQRLVDGMAVVGDAEIAAALRLVMERCKLAAEPSGAAAVAGLLSGQLDVPAGSTVVAVISGGNIDAATLGNIL